MEKQDQFYRKILAKKQREELLNKARMQHPQNNEKVNRSLRKRKREPPTKLELEERLAPILEMLDVEGKEKEGLNYDQLLDAFAFIRNVIINNRYSVDECTIQEKLCDWVNETKYQSLREELLRNQLSEKQIRYLQCEAFSILLNSYELELNPFVCMEKYVSEGRSLVDSVFNSEEITMDLFEKTEDLFRWLFYQTNAGRAIDEFYLKDRAYIDYDPEMITDRAFENIATMLNPNYLSWSFMFLSDNLYHDAQSLAKVFDVSYDLIKKDVLNPSEYDLTDLNSNVIENYFFYCLPALKGNQVKKLIENEFFEKMLKWNFSYRTKVLIICTSYKFNTKLTLESRLFDDCLETYSDDKHSTEYYEPQSATLVFGMLFDIIKDRKYALSLLRKKTFFSYVCMHCGDLDTEGYENNFPRKLFEEIITYLSDNKKTAKIQKDNSQEIDWIKETVAEWEREDLD